MLKVISFVPILIDDRETVVVKKTYMKEILKWYKTQLKDLSDCYPEINIIKIFKREIKIYILLEVNDKEFPFEILSDPDDDGNYPLSFDGKEYLISSESSKITKIK